MTIAVVVVGIIVIIGAVKGLQKSNEYIEHRSNARDARRFPAVQERTRQADIRRRLNDQAARENEVMHRWGKTLKHAKNDMQSYNPKKQARGKAAHEAALKHMNEELGLIHRIAGSARVHPQTGQNQGGIRRG